MIMMMFQYWIPVQNGAEWADWAVWQRNTQSVVVVIVVVVENHIDLPTMIVIRLEGQRLRWQSQSWSNPIRSESETVRLVMLHAAEHPGGRDWGKLGGFGWRV